MSDLTPKTLVDRLLQFEPKAPVGGPSLAREAADEIKRLSLELEIFREQRGLEGWKLVPVNPTCWQTEAGTKNFPALALCQAAAVYNAMVLAAPKPD